MSVASKERKVNDYGYKISKNNIELDKSFVVVTVDSLKVAEV